MTQHDSFHRVQPLVTHRPRRTVQSPAMGSLYPRCRVSDNNGGDTTRPAGPKGPAGRSCGRRCRAVSKTAGLAGRTDRR